VIREKNREYKREKSTPTITSIARRDLLWTGNLRKKGGGYSVWARKEKNRNSSDTKKSQSTYKGEGEALHRLYSEKKRNKTRRRRKRRGEETEASTR